MGENLVIGRKKEQALLESALKSQSAELIALYGRRRVGKTYLIRNTFAQRKDMIFFTVTGMKDGIKSQQIENFKNQVAAAFYQPHSRLQIPQNWFDAFDILRQEIKASTADRIVLFFDEFPWMVTKKSELLTAFEYFWNEHISQDCRVKVIICGSSAGWIIKNIVNNRGAFYNRVTRKIQLEPFNLQQTKEFLAYRKVTLNNKQISHIYMVLGGIPFYLSHVQPGLSAVQIIADLAFDKNSFLLEEFENLYATLFDAGDAHIKLARAIAAHRNGVSQADLANTLPHLHSGGTLVKWLKDLEQAGFIKRFLPYQVQKKGIYYKLSDEYSLFYFRWIEPIKSSIQSIGMKKEYWENVQQTPAWYSWAGYAFEAICYKHVFQIMDALNISPTAVPYTWRKARSDEQGAQIDLLFDRTDSTITLCEIKYTDDPFAIDKSYAEKLNKKMKAFATHTKTDKLLLFDLISAQGLKPTLYSEMIAASCSLEDLFKE
jgi:AAA+ ATPase superfamily predicted ATPase